MRERPTQPRPVLVRAVVGQSSSRRKVQSQLAFLVLISGICLALTTLLASRIQVAFVLMWGATAFLAGGAIWIGLAMRWIDRNGRWG
jgi:hypothetical protein